MATSRGWQTYLKSAYLRHEEANNVDAGGQATGAWVDRKINVLEDPYSIVTSLASNQFTLPAGRYAFICEINGGVSTDNVGVRLRNITDGTTTLNGIGDENNPSTGSDAWTSGDFTISSPKTFSIQMRVGVTNNTQGWGQANGFGETEVYLIAKITRLDI